jgi:hypothetical protein
MEMENDCKIIGTELSDALNGGLIINENKE